MGSKFNLTLPTLEVFLIILAVLIGDTILAATYYTRQSNDWNRAQTWSTVGCGGAQDGGTPGAGDNVVVCEGHTLDLNNGNRSCTDFELQAGAYVVTSGRNLAVSGDAIINGTYGDEGTNGVFDLTGTNQTIDGTGVIETRNGVDFEGGDKSFLSTAVIFIRRRSDIDNNITVTNYGSVEFDHDLRGGGANAKWINDANSTLISNRALLATGILECNATGNTVQFSQAGAQDIKEPVDSIFHNLTIGGNNTKTLLDYTVINGDLNLVAELDADGFEIILKGDWISDGGTFTPNANTVTLNGSSDQTFTNALGETVYDLVIDKSSGDVILDNDLTVSNSLTMTSGNVVATTGTLELGDACGNVGSLTHTSGSVIGYFKRWINNTTTPGPPVVWPTGTSSTYNPASITFNAVTTCGSITASLNESDPGSSGLPLGEAPLSPTDSLRNTFVDGYWTFTVGDGFATTDYDLNLDGSGFSGFTINSTTRLLNRTSSGSDWGLNGTHSAAVGSVVKRTGMTSFPGEFAFGDTTNCSGPVTSAITGLDSVCTSELAVAYSVSYVPPPVSSFNWEVTGGTIVAGQGLNNIVVNWGSDGGAGSVQVTQNNGCTDGAPVSMDVDIHSMPPSSITGSTGVGDGATGVPYYVTAGDGYTYTWTITGGTQASGGTSDSITVDWGSSGSGNVRVVANSSCGSSDPVDLPVSIYTTIESIGTGNFTQAATWDCGCTPPETSNIIVKSGHTVTVNQNLDINSVEVEAGGTLQTGNRRLTANGDVTINGTFTANTRFTLAGNSTVSLGGSGTITISGNVLRLNGANVNIAPGADLTVTANEFEFRKSGISVTNNGTITIVGDITETDATNSWINGANSTLNIDGAIFGAGGTMLANSSNNTVNYNSAGAQTVFCTNSGDYGSLTLSGSGTKSIGCALDLSGNLSIEGTAVLDVTAANNYGLEIGGSWSNTSTNGDPFLEQNGAVTFDGTGAQSITNNNVEDFYDFTLNKTSGTLTLNDSIVISSTTGGTLTMTQGTIDANGKILTLGTSTANEGTLSYTDGLVIGKVERWANTVSTPYVFPIGVSGNYRPASLTFNAGLTGGSVIAEFVETDPESAGLFLDETSDTIFQTYSEGYWDLTAANSLASSDHNVEITGAGFASEITAETRVLTRANSSSDWELNGTHVPASSNTAKRNNNTQMSVQYCMGDTAACDPPATSAITGQDSVCTNVTGEAYSVSAGGASSTFNWIITGGTQASGTNTNSITVDWGATGMVGKVECVQISQCGISDTVSLDVTLHSLPTSSITGKAESISQLGPNEVYSVESNDDYTYTWAIAQGGGTIQSGQGTSSIEIAWSSAGADTVRVTASTGCNSAAVVELPISVYTGVSSVQTGNWNDPNTWSCTCDPIASDNIVIDSNHTVTLTQNDTVNFLYVNATGTLNTNGFDIVIDGDLAVNGTLSGSGDLTMDDANGSISGTGDLTHTGAFNINEKTSIFSTADLTFNSSAINIEANDTLDNQGTITVTNDVTGGNATSHFINSDNATVNVGGSMMTTGKLTASATGNTVNYNGSGAQTVKAAETNQYHTLSVAGSGTKSLAASTDCDGDVLFAGTAVLDVTGSNYDLTVAGNWADSSGAATPFEAQSGTVTFNGTAAQTISNPGGESFYNVTVNKSSGTLSLSDNVIVSNASGGTLTMTTGNIDTGSDTLTLGTSTSNEGTLAYTAGAVIGYFERWANATATAYTFPIGTATNYRPAEVTFSNLGGGAMTAGFVSSAPGSAGLPVGDGPMNAEDIFTEGYWDIGATSGLTSTDYDITLKGDGFTSQSFTTDMRVLSRANSGADWAGNGDHVDAVGNLGKRNTLTSLPLQFALVDTSGCSGLPATSDITGQDSVCVNVTGEAYSVTNNAGNMYFWTIIGGTQASGGVTNSITVDWGSTGQVGTVRVIENDACGNHDPVDLSVDIHALPTDDISGLTSLQENTQDEAYTLEANNNYTYTWSTTEGLGTVDAGQGTNTITMDWGAAGNDTIKVVANMGCGSDSTTLPIQLTQVITSVGSGNFSTSGTWDCSCIPTSTDNIIIAAGHSVTLTANTTMDDLTIEATAILDNSTYTSNITGDYVVNGTHSGSGDINVQGSSTVIEGTGTINNTGYFRLQNDRTIASGTNLTHNSDIRIASGVNITNEGTVTVEGNLIGVTGTATWINEGSSRLNIDGELLLTGVLTCGDPGTDTVAYQGTSGQTIKTPSNHYNHLLLSGNTTKTLAGNTTIKQGLTISGASTDFNTADYDLNFAGTWTNDGIFTPGASEVTFSGNTTFAGGTEPSFDEVTVEAGDTLVAPSGNLNITGSFVVNGVFEHNNGTIVLNGTGAQSLTLSDTTDVGNITLDNAAGASITSGSLRVMDLMTITNGTFTTNDSLIIGSDANGTGSIGPITGTISGDVSVERYLDGASNEWYFLGVPITDFTFEDFNEEAVTTGFTGSDFPTHSFVNIYTYDETAVGSSANGYETPSNVTDALAAGMGFQAYINLPGGSLTLSHKGTIVQGNFAFPITYTDDPGQPASEDGWNMLGNPYPSTIDWDDANWTRTNVDDAIYIWNSTSEVYATYISGVGTNGGSRYIPSNQGFWVHATGTPTLEITENVKVTNDPTYLKTASSEPEFISIIADNGYGEDEMAIRISAEATPLFDDNLDALNLPGGGKNFPDIYSEDETGEQYSIMSVHPNQMASGVELYVPKTVAEEVTLHIGNLSSIVGLNCASILDVSSGTSYELTQDASYTFPTDPAGNTFLITATQTGSAEVYLTDHCLTSEGVEADIELTGAYTTGGYWELTNGNDEIMQTMDAQSQGASLDIDQAGVYTMTFNPEESCNETASSVVNFEVQSAINIETIVNDPTCSNPEGGIAVASATGGWGTPILTWSDGTIGDSLIGAAAGVHQVMAEDYMGCTAVEEVTIGSANLVTALIHMTDTNTTLAPGQQVTLQNYSSGATSFNWVWDNNTHSGINATVSFLTIGEHDVNLIASNGECTDTSTVTFTVEGIVIGVEDVVEELAPNTLNWLTTIGGFSVVNLNNETTEVTLTNVTGQILQVRKIQPGQSANFTIDQPGIYLLSDQVAGRSYKVVK